MEEKFMKNFLLRFIDEKQTDRIVSVLDRAEKRMGAWMWGEVLLMTIIGLVTYIGLMVLQVHYALPLAVLAGLFEVVPIIGPIISLVPAFFVTAATSWSLGIFTIILYVTIQQLENNIVVPMVMRRAVGLHPIVTLSALTIGGKLGGFLGMLLSVPIALLIETVFIEFTRVKK
jgi:predicted PurR-regulated permease PerM